MSGVELLFIDGGATVTAAAGAVAGWLGFKQSARDKEELVDDVAELRELLEAVRRQRLRVDDGHQELSNAWPTPLSLFDSNQEQKAAARGVPAWAINCAHKASLLVEEAVALKQYAEAYETQLGIAEEEMARDGEGRYLQRAPIRRLIAQLEDLAPRLVTQRRFLSEARVMFDAPPAAEAARASEPEDYVTAEDEGIAHRIETEEPPELVLRKKGAWAGLVTVPKKALKSQMETFRDMTGMKAKQRSVEKQPSEPAMSPSSTRAAREARREELLRQLRHHDWSSRRQAAEELGNFGDPAVVPELRERLRNDDSQYVRERAATSLGHLGDEAAVPELCGALRDVFLRSSAVAALQQIGCPSTAPIIFAALKNDEDALAASLAQYAERQKAEQTASGA